MFDTSELEFHCHKTWKMISSGLFFNLFFYVPILVTPPSNQDCCKNRIKDKDNHFSYYKVMTVLLFAGGRNTQKTSYQFMVARQIIWVTIFSHQYSGLSIFQSLDGLHFGLKNLRNKNNWIASWCALLRKKPFLLSQHPWVVCKSDRIYMP